MAGDAVEIDVRVLEDLVDLSVVERRMEPSGEPLRPPAGAPASRLGNRPERRFDPGRREANGSRELDVQQQEFDNSPRPQIGGIATAIGLERRDR